MTDMLELGSRPETLEEFASLHMETVREIAQQIYRKFGTVESEDIEQGIWEAVIKTFDKAFSGLDESTARSRIHRVGMNYQNSEDMDLMHFSGNYTYTPSEVRLKLATCVWVELDKCPDVDAKIDLQAAFEALPPKQRMALFKRYGMKTPLEEMSVAEKRALFRGADGICVWLNRRNKTTALRLDEEADREEAEEFLTESFHGTTYGEEFR